VETRNGEEMSGTPSSVKNFDFRILLPGPGGEEMPPEERGEVQKKSFPQGRPPRRESGPHIVPTFKRGQLETGIHPVPLPVAGRVKIAIPAREKPV